ncbi:4'-phosphopantetheinyl transferase family protein [Bacillus vallismortis]|uniref:4'-phosphopantetheinyl transferase family protein n=1 Tax=Bacillus vallismortis TaxID=72361 RepID=UPI003B97F814
MLEIEFKEVIPYFTYQEQMYLNSLKEDKKFDFYKMWKVKESYMKYTGLGFSLDLNSFSVPLQESGRVRLKDSTNKESPFSSFLLAEYYYISVCSEQVKNKKIIF